MIEVYIVIYEGEYDGVYDSIEAIKADFADDKNEETMYMSDLEYLTYLERQNISVFQDWVLTTEHIDSLFTNNETINML